MLRAVYFSVLGVDNHTLWDFLDFLVWNVNISTFINSQVSFMRFYRRKRRPSIDCYGCTTTKLLPVPVGAGHLNETQNSEGLRFSTRTSGPLTPRPAATVSWDFAKSHSCQRLFLRTVPSPFGWRFVALNWILGVLFSAYFASEHDEKPVFTAVISFDLRRGGCVKTPAVPAFDMFTKTVAAVLQSLSCWMNVSTLFLILWLQPVPEDSKCCQWFDEQSLNQGLIV